MTGALSGKRSIVFDTETTGLSPIEGDRIIEIGAVELRDLMPTGREFYALLDPERSIPAGATEVHGIKDADVRGKPLFSSIASAFREFVGDAELVAHNASFDMEFLNAEYDRADLPRLRNVVVDTLPMARRRVVGHVTLDALCKKFGIDLSSRQKHGALIDARLLAKVYLELCGGAHFTLNFSASSEAMNIAPTNLRRVLPERSLGMATDRERDIHAEFASKFVAAEAMTTLRMR